MALGYTVTRAPLARLRISFSSADDAARISEKRGSRLEFRAESFNVFNHTQFQGSNSGGISNNFSASNFGQITSAFDPREFQLGLKAYF